MKTIVREIPLPLWNSDNTFTLADTLLLVFSAIVAIACQVAAFRYTQPKSHAQNDPRQASTSVENVISEPTLASKK